MFSTKTLCQMFFQTCLKDFKLKKLVVEPDEEPIDPQLNWSRVQKNSLSSRTVVQPVKVEPQQVEVRSRSNSHLPNIKC